MGAIASQISSLTIVYSTVYSSVDQRNIKAPSHWPLCGEFAGADQRKHHSSAPLAFVWGIRRWPVNSPHKWPVMRKMFPFDDVIIENLVIYSHLKHSAGAIFHGTLLSWWHHQMQTLSALLAICEGNSPVTGEFRMTQSFDVFLDLRLNKRLSKPSRCRWFQTPLRSLWRHCNDGCLSSNTSIRLSRCHWSNLNVPWWVDTSHEFIHYGDVIMGEVASQTTSLTIVYSTFWSDADQRKHQSSALLAFARGIHRLPVNSPHKWPVTRKMLPFDDVIMINWYCDHSKPKRNKTGPMYYVTYPIV